MRLDNKYDGFGAIWLITVTLLVNVFTLAESCYATGIAQYSVSPTDKTVSIANLICTGKFAAVKELLATEKESNAAGIDYLADIVSEYETIERKRQVIRANAYQEQLDKLEKFHTKTDSEEAYDVTDVLQIILKASEYATAKQRQILLKDVFVKRVIKKAIIKADELDASGEWLEAYKNYYGWLEKIEPNNQLYSDRAAQLAAKADIKESLQDSPCETWAERYMGVERQIFIEAINTLDTDYVVRIVDYRQMAIKAIERCGMLAEVMAESDSGMSNNKNTFKKWSIALKAIIDEINASGQVVSKDKFIDIFEEVLVLNTTSVKLPKAVLIVQFAKGALSALDPYTVVIWPNKVRDFDKRLNGKFSGIGITFSNEKGSWVVSSLLLNTPAYESGLNVGDVIEAVDRVETEEMTTDCMIKKITGPAGTAVTLTVKASDENRTRDITITRANVTIPSIRGWQRTSEGKWRYMIDSLNQIGYIRITTFTERTAIDFEEVLWQLETEGLRGLILDLRSNRGGVVNAAAEIVDNFIEKGMIVSTCPRYGMATYISAHKEKTRPGYPIVVLTNKKSASASEIAAGALQDKEYKRAILVGERTYGKGSVQNIKRLSGNAKLKYTTAYYRLPSGQRVGDMEAAKKARTEDWGITPDVEVELDSEELKKIATVQKSNETLRNPDKVHAPGSVRTYSSRDIISSDPQLAIGLLVLKSKMVQMDYSMYKNKKNKPAPFSGQACLYDN